MPNVVLYILPPDIINLKHHRLNVELRLMTEHRAQGKRVMNVFGLDAKTNVGYRMNLIEGTLSSSDVTRIERLTSEVRSYLRQDFKAETEAFRSLQMMKLLDYLVLGVEITDPEKLQERAQKLKIQITDISPAINYRCLNQLLSHQVSGDEVLKGLKVEGFDISGYKLRENYLCGWNLEYDGEPVHLSRILLSPSLQKETTSE